MTKRKLSFSLICGILGCLCLGGGDWLMMFGDVNYRGKLFWLTDGVANIAPWRNTLAMALSFPGIIFYGIALFAIADFINNKREKKIYNTLITFSLTPWLCLHLFYIMILYLFSWLNQNGYAEMSLTVSEALYNHLSWIVFISEIFMLPPFIYWFWLQFKKKTIFPKALAFTNILIIYAVLYIIKMLLPNSPFRIGFTNGLMSESMLIWFIIVFLTSRKYNKEVLGDGRKETQI
ncbi:MAG: DUF6796 family protein [Candidatus Pseudoruminococcus sp.]|nr:hypothetical protein [Ruminococcus sp.]MDY2783373.1 DUF6796 family protein [Candidatus Pseudoruminococcus sp.]